MSQRNDTPTIQIQDASGIPSPCLVVFPQCIEDNIARMIEIAGNPERLRPHVKTCKISEVVTMQLAKGISKFKCATLSEAQMLIRAGAKDILIAMQPVGPDIAALAQLSQENLDTTISTIADNFESIHAIESESAARGYPLGLYLDINAGMNRTGIAPGELALQLYRAIVDCPTLNLRGLHIYDGHIRDPNPINRSLHVEDDFKSSATFISTIKASGLPLPNIVIGGSPTFPIHAERSDFELSPGTTLLWDFGYGDAFKDLPFKHAALIFTRVISKPADGLICLDLGHKAIASEMPHPRVRLIGLEDAEFVSQSEEHLAVQTKSASEIKVGDAFFGIPKHICPTVALHNKVAVVEEGKLTGYWTVSARDRILD